QNIEQQSDDGHRAARGPEHVGRTDVAAAKRTNVSARRHPDDQVPKRNAADQISCDDCQHWTHRVGTGKSATFEYTEPAEPGRLKYKWNRSASKEPNSKDSIRAMACRIACSGTGWRIRARVRCGANGRC